MDTETSRVLTHDFWLELAAFVCFLLAGAGITYPAPPRHLGWIGAALLALALLW